MKFSKVATYENMSVQRKKWHIFKLTKPKWRMYEVLKGSHSHYLVTLTPEQPLRDLTTERQKPGYLGSAYGLTQCMLYSPSDPHKLDSRAVP